MYDKRLDRVRIGNHHATHPFGHIELGHAIRNADIFGAIFRFKNALVGRGIREIIARHAVAVEHLDARIHIHIEGRRRHFQSIDAQNEARAFRLVVEVIDRLHALGHRKRRGAVGVFTNRRIVNIDERLQATGILGGRFGSVAIVLVNRIGLETHPVRGVERGHIAGNNHMPARRYGIIIGNAGIAFLPPLQKRVQIPLIVDVAVHF